MHSFQTLPQLFDSRASSLPLATALKEEHIIHIMFVQYRNTCKHIFWRQIQKSKQAQQWAHPQKTLLALIMNSQRSAWRRIVKRTALHQHTSFSSRPSSYAPIDQHSYNNNSSNNSSNNPLHPIRFCKWMTMLNLLHYFYCYIIIIINLTINMIMAQNSFHLIPNSVDFPLI